MSVDTEMCAECGEPLVVEDRDNPDGDPLHVFCDICGRVEHPADLTLGWNGGTGSHRLCDPSETPLRTRVR